jgi:ATP-binding cassette subfamily F protein uup
MANLISLERAAKSYAHRTLLDGVSLGVSTGDRIGIVGRNGAGKSTLLALLAGITEPDTGRVARVSGLRAGYLPQADQLTGTAGEIVFGTARLDTPWEADPRAREIVAGLLTGISLDASAARLSGGERRRVALAGLLAAGRDVLLLDEPTNHLDIEAIDWLGRHLRDRGSAVVVVSHDRWLLDTVCDRTWEVDRGHVHSAEGGYSAYVLAQAERERVEDTTERRRQNLARKELAWLRRGPQARGTKPKFRVQEANTLIAAEPPARDSVELTRMATARLGKTVLELEEVTLSAAGRPLLSDLTWQLGPGDRVGIVGVNGSGKTSLLRLLADEIGPGLDVSGTVVRGKTVRLAHLSQDLSELDENLRVREAVEEVRLRIRVGDRELSAAQLLERLGFPAERQRTRVGDLSGGERRRVQMLRLLMDEPNVLLLDEPTNDLDIETLTEFEDLLDGWPGTLVVVSHDRYFLERVTDRALALLGDGKLSFLPGGVDEYLDRIREARANSIPVSTGLASADTASASARPSAAAERSARKELQRLERQLERLTTREAELSAELAAAATNDTGIDYERLTTLGAELRQVQADKADIEDRWLTVASELS